MKCLDIFRMADSIKLFLKNSMRNWETELAAGGESLENVKIKWGIFQGESLSPLLYVISLIPISLLLRKVKAGYELSKTGPIMYHL